MKKNIGLIGQSIGQTFNRYRNADHLFSGDINAFIGDRYRKHICFADDNGDQGGGDQGGKDGSQDNDKPITITTSQLTKLIDDAVDKRLGNDDQGGNDEEKNKGKSNPSEEARRKDQERQDREKQRKNDQEMALYNVQFDGFILDNKGFFPDSVKTIREDAEKEAGTDLDKLVPLLHAGSARLFFERESNLTCLDKSDQEYVKKSILDTRYDSQIDHSKAWRLVQNSIHTQNLMNDNNKRRNSGSNSENGLYGQESLDNRLGKWFPKHVKDTTE